MYSKEQQIQFINEALAAHNELRLKHGVPILKHNQELSDLAQNWANNIASRDKLEHSTYKYKNNNLGENVVKCFLTGAKKYDGARATKQWYNEISNYDWNKPDFSKRTGHFTQVVWKNSAEVGFGLATAANGAFYAVANYFPAGNYLGQFKENVLKNK